MTTIPSVADHPSRTGPLPANGRLAGAALMAGTALEVAGFLAVSLAVRASGDARYTDPLWVPLYGVILTGALLVVLGLPAVLVVQGAAARRLTLVGYVGIFVPLAVLNVAETSMEAFVKPYLVRHGGIPDADPTGLAVFESVALLFLVVGLITLAIAVFRARVLPRWVGVALLATLVASFVVHDWPFSLISDYCIHAALFRIGLAAVRRTRDAA